MQIYSHFGIIYLISTVFAFLAIKILADHIASSRHYVIDYEKSPEMSAGERFGPDELIHAIGRAHKANDAKRATKGLPVLVDDLSLNQGHGKAAPTADDVGYCLDQLEEAGKIARYRNLIASPKGGEESLGAYYIYELAMKEDAYVIKDDCKELLKANNAVMAKDIDQWEKEEHTANDSNLTVISLGTGQANSLRKRMFSYDAGGGHLLFMLSNGLIRCIEA